MPEEARGGVTCVSCDRPGDKKCTACHSGSQTNLLVATLISFTCKGTGFNPIPGYTIIYVPHRIN